MNTAKKVRRSHEGGYIRGDETRRRIIEAAIELFSERGFQGASTRDIAACASVNPPALQYYFESKEGVYRACAESLADDAWKTLGPAIDNAQEALRTNATTEVMIDILIRIYEALADTAFAKASNPGRRLFFAREQAGHEPDSATAILNFRIREPLNGASTALVARISGRPLDDPLTLIRTFILHGQLAIFYVAHRSTLSMLGWEGIDPEKAEQIKSTLRDQTRTLLEQWRQERNGRPAAGSSDADGSAKFGPIERTARHRGHANR